MAPAWVAETSISSRPVTTGDGGFGPDWTFWYRQDPYGMLVGWRGLARVLPTAQDTS